MKYAIIILTAAAGAAELIACASDSGIDDRGVESGDGGQDTTEPDDGGSSGEELPSVDAGAASDAQQPLACGDAGYCDTRLPLSNLGEPLSMRSVWAVSKTDVWSVALEGYILHWDGTSWRVDHRVGHPLYAVRATTSSVWVGGDLGMLLRRGADGSWTSVETGHTAPIRAIGGTSDSDMWFASRDGTVDHFDGITLTNHSLGGPVQLMTIFGDTAGGMYAAGLVQAASPENNQPYVYALSTAAITPFNANFSTTRGFVPIGGAVVSSPDEDPRVLLAGYKGTQLTDAFVSASDYNEPVGRACYTLAAPPSSTEAYPNPSSSIYALSRSDVYMPCSIYQILRWDGGKYSIHSLGMARNYLPRPIAGIHGADGDVWMVGDGFALKGRPL